MMHEFDLKVRIFLQDPIAIGRSVVVERIIRDRRKGRLQPCQRFERGLRPRIFLAVEGKAAVLAMDRNQALAEMAGLDVCGGLLLALVAEPIDILPRDALERRDGVGTDALATSKRKKARRPSGHRAGLATLG